MHSCPSGRYAYVFTRQIPFQSFAFNKTQNNIFSARLSLPRFAPDSSRTRAKLCCRNKCRKSLRICRMRSRIYLHRIYGYRRKSPGELRNTVWQWFARLPRQYELLVLCRWPKQCLQLTRQTDFDKNFATSTSNHSPIPTAYQNPDSIDCCDC